MKSCLFVVAEGRWGEVRLLQLQGGGGELGHVSHGVMDDSPVGDLRTGTFSGILSPPHLSAAQPSCAALAT